MAEATACYQRAVQLKPAYAEIPDYLELVLLVCSAPRK